MRRTIAWWLAFGVSLLSQGSALIPSPNSEKPPARREGRVEHEHVPEKHLQGPPPTPNFAQVATTTGGYANGYAFFLNGRAVAFSAAGHPEIVGVLVTPT